jgi:hypothetical protein
MSEIIFRALATVNQVLLNHAPSKELVHSSPSEGLIFGGIVIRMVARLKRDQPQLTKPQTKSLVLLPVIDEWTEPPNHSSELTDE